MAGIQTQRLFRWGLSFRASSGAPRSALSARAQAQLLGVTSVVKYADLGKPEPPTWTQRMCVNYALGICTDIPFSRLQRHLIPSDGID